MGSTLPKSISVKAICQKIIFQSKDGFKIALFKDDSSAEPIKVKGTMYIVEGNYYQVKAELDQSNPRFPDTYFALNVKYDIDLEKADAKQMVTFLSTITSYRLAKALVDELPDLVSILENGDIDSLTKVNGFGLKNAEKLIDAYSSQKDFSEAFIQMEKFNLTKEAIIKVCKFFKNIDKAISLLNDDPYNLTKVPGFGFKKADTAFLMMCKNCGGDVNDPRRVKAYIDFLFEEEFAKGNTWITPVDLVSKTLEFIPSANVKAIASYVNQSEKYYSLNVENPLFGELGKRIVPKSNLLLEMNIANRLREIATQESVMELTGIEEAIAETEEKQGWQYSLEQRNAISALIKNDVCLIQGPAGTGKTSVVNAFTSILKKNGYSFAQCALSGKAANNLSLVTGEQGSTIHSLTRYGTNFPANKTNPLPYNVFILDEVSMPDAWIFLTLLNAIPKGSKLIMLGDIGQLESISVGVMNGIIKSKAIPAISLKEIHRQAKDSGIITHSSYFRNGKMPKELGLATNESQIFGVKQDLEYVLVDNDDEKRISELTMRAFKEKIKEFGVDGVQIICPTKTAGTTSTFKLNQYAQIIANPKEDGKPEIEVKGENGTNYFLRLNDKIINHQNNKTTHKPNDKNTLRPIFNGNTGVIKEIIVEGKNETLIIDFDGIGEVEVSNEAIKHIHLGYAITVHKCQGSTIPCVLLALPFHFLLNSRELVYTGVTRASKYQIIFTSPKTLKAALKKTSKRTERTNLDMFIRELNAWKEKLNINLEKDEVK